MAIEGINIGDELLSAPMGEMIHKMASAIADAQWQLDKSSLVVAEFMSGQRILRDLDTGKLLTADNRETTTPTVVDSRIFFGYVYNVGEDGKPVATPNKVSMLELGFTPNFYQFVDTIMEVKIAISLTRSTESRSSVSSGSSYSAKTWWGSSGVSTSQVNGSYSAKYNFSVEGSSLLRTKLVSIPPPAILEERIRQVSRQERSFEQWKLLTDLEQRIMSELNRATTATPRNEDDVKKLETQRDDVRQQIRDIIQNFGTDKN